MSVQVKLLVRSRCRDLCKPTRLLSAYARIRYLGTYEPLDSEMLEDPVAIVYLQGAPQLKLSPPPEKPVVMKQENMQIVPHLLPIQTGTKVRFPNKDNVFHNLFSLSPSKTFDFGRYPKNEYRDLVFDELGDVRIFCDIHPSMSAVILVLPNSYFATVYADGSFKISDVPDGEYKIHAWHEKFPEQSKNVKIAGNQIVPINFVLGPKN